MSIEPAPRAAKARHPGQAAVVALLVSAAVMLQRTNDVLRPYGITHDQYNVLRILRGAQPGGHPRVEIGKRMVSRAPDVTRLLDRLERQGLIARGWAPENRRLSIARITPAGLELLAAADPEILALQSLATKGLTRDELATLVRACEHIAG